VRARRIASLKKYHLPPPLHCLIMESFFLISILLAKDVEEEKKLRGEKRKGVYKNRKSRRKRE
jgi:hypothetical protein